MLNILHIEHEILLASIQPFLSNNLQLSESSVILQQFPNIVVISKLFGNFNVILQHNIVNNSKWEYILYVI